MRVFNANTNQFEEVADPAPETVKKEEPVAKEKEKEDDDPDTDPEKVKEGDDNPDNDDPEKGKEKDKDDPDSEKEEFDGPDAYIKETLGEKFEINTESELLERLEAADEILQENEELKAQLKEKGEAKPKFDNDGEEKLFKFIKDIGYNPAKFSEGLQTYARVMSIDENTDGRIAMEEKYILDHPELTREEAQYKFSKHYTKNFAPLNRDDFESDEEFKEAEKERQIDKKTAEAKAREVIAKKQKDFKSTSDKEDKSGPEVNEAVSRSIERNAKEFESHISAVTEIIFSPEESEDDDFALKFSPDQLKKIRAVCDNWIKNPANYDEKGKLIGDQDPEVNFKRAAYLLFGDEIVAKNYEHAKTIYSIQRAEQISTTTPNRKSKTGDAGKVALTEEQQWQNIIANKKKKVTS
jgi:hypothetical protein